MRKIAFKRARKDFSLVGGRITDGNKLLAEKVEFGHELMNELIIIIGAPQG